VITPNWVKSDHTAVKCRSPDYQVVIENPGKPMSCDCIKSCCEANVLEKSIIHTLTVVSSSHMALCQKTRVLEMKGARDVC